MGFAGASFNRIGGARTEDRNVISGNVAGVDVFGPAATGNLVLGNFIGTDVTGGRILGDGSRGVRLGGGSRTIVGGMTSGEANVISGTSDSAVEVEFDDNFVAGNYIGTDLGGQIAMGTGRSAASASGLHNVFQRNVIPHSGAQGIMPKSDGSTTIRRNSIYSNAGKGIWYPGGSVAIPSPVITKIENTSISGTACPGCEVEIFSDSEDEGRLFEGSVVAGGSGSFTLTMQRFLIGPNVTATATDWQGNTSELSVPHAAPPRPPRRRAVRP